MNLQPVLHHHALPPSGDLLLLFFASILGSAHCIGMCGPYVAICAARLAPEGASASVRLLVRLLFNAGRLATYAAIGWIVGSMGQIALFALPPGLSGTVAVVAGLLAPDQQDCQAERVECVECPQGPPCALSSQLTHLRITGASNFRAVRETEGRTEFHEKPNRVRHIVLLFFGESVPPIPEFVCELDFPRHTYSMPYTEYSPWSMTHDAG